MSAVSQVTEVVCPEGHVLNAPAGAVGKTLPCPICQSPVHVHAPSRNPVTDTGVMRILGDADFSKVVRKEAPSTDLQRDKLSDTGVMRILGDFVSSPQPESAELPNSRPCPVCSCDVSESASVCQHCDSYIGVSPDYLRTLTQEPSETQQSSETQKPSDT